MDNDKTQINNDGDKTIVNDFDDRTVVNFRSNELPSVMSPVRVIKPGYMYLNRYKVIDELGKGAMGVVFRCYDEVAGIDVALKAIPPEVSRDSVEMESIRDNFQLVHKLHHPGIANANTLEKDQETGDYFLIMECVEGVNLYQYYKSRGYNPSLSMALPVLRQIAEALDYAHAQKIIHRDIKPSNVQITTEGVVKILDFGLAQQIQSSIMRITGAGYSKGGTPYFMSPEQWKGHFQDAATDQYAFAVVVYQLIAGKCPFQSTDMMVLREMVLNEKPPKPDQLNDVEWKVLKKSLEKERIARYKSCTELVEQLEKAVTLTSSSRRHSFEGATRVSPGGKPFSQAAAKSSKKTKRKKRYRPPPRILSTNRMVAGIVSVPVLLGVLVAACAVSWGKINKDAINQKATYLAAFKSGALAAKAGDYAKAQEQTEVALHTGIRDTSKIESLQRAIIRRTTPAAGTERKIPLAQGVDLDLVWIPAGQFFRGSFFDGHFDEEPVHEVAISKGFWISKYEITQVQYAAVTGQNPSQHPGNRQPVDSVSWKEAVAFTEQISTQGLSFRLPTEAEWEYAARGGRQAQYAFGNATSELFQYANYADASTESPLVTWKDSAHDDGFPATAPVGSFKPNAYGLYDMSGNVSEWCADYYHAYGSDSLTDPAGPPSGEQRVARGGSWASAPTYCRSAARNEFQAVDDNHGTKGIRVVLDAR